MNPSNCPSPCWVIWGIPSWTPPVAPLSGTLYLSLIPSTDPPEPSNLSHSAWLAEELNPIPFWLALHCQTGAFDLPKTPCQDVNRHYWKARHTIFTGLMKNYYSCCKHTVQWWPYFYTGHAVWFEKAAKLPQEKCEVSWIGLAVVKPYCQG